MEVIAPLFSERHGHDVGLQLPDGGTHGLIAEVFHPRAKHGIDSVAVIAGATRATRIGTSSIRLRNGLSSRKLLVPRGNAVTIVSQDVGEGARMIGRRAVVVKLIPNPPLEEVRMPFFARRPHGEHVQRHRLIPSGGVRCEFPECLGRRLQVVAIEKARCARGFPLVAARTEELGYRRFDSWLGSFVIWPKRGVPG